MGGLHAQVYSLLPRASVAAVVDQDAKRAGEKLRSLGLKCPVFSDLEEALRSPSDTGLSLHLDLSLFERLEIYVRGNCELSRVHSSWRSRWREEVREVHRIDVVSLEAD